MVACLSLTWTWFGIYLLSILTNTALALASTGKTQTTIAPIAESTCPPRGTVNYITATLPQQCLRTDWDSGIQRTTTTTVADASIAASTAASSTTTSSSETPNEQDAEADPLSDNANFLSFEEWKAQMLQKSGQSPEHVAAPNARRRKEVNGAPSINNALDGYGEDGELEIEFGGFPIPDVSANGALPTVDTVSNSKVSHDMKDTEKPQKKSKEAGTTSKHRFNYASFDCAATVLKTNKGSKGSTSILSENKDSYMINACSLPNKFVIVELCDDIKIDTIVLGNFEFFSSTFRSFRVSVADRYPVKHDKWEDLGTFEARNARGIQPFLVENMRTWARYLRVEFLTHYGAEYYCPVSLLRVHGKTMIDDWKADVGASQGDDDVDEDEEAEAEATSTKITSSSSTATPIQLSTIITEPKPEATPDYSFYDDKCPRFSLPGPLVEQTKLLSSACQLDWKFCNMAKVQQLSYTSVVYQDVRITKDKHSHHVSGDRKTKSTSDHQKQAAVGASTHTPSQISRPSDAKASAVHSSKTISSSTAAKVTTKVSDIVSAVKHAEARPSTGAKSNNNAPAGAPQQDSFFRSVHKRLQQLEANSTLSLQYIEEQSRILREAFTKVEKRQLSKTSSFLENLNATVLNELHQFRLQYDQIWQSTVLELSAQREQSRIEVTALSLRLTLLANEVVWQKRLAIVQFALILLCLALVMFSRNAMGTSTFDVPLLQSMVSRSRLGLKRHVEPFYGSLSESPPRPASGYERLSQAWTRSQSPQKSDMSDNDLGVNGDNVTDTLNGVYQLPTPTSEIDDLQLVDAGIHSRPDGTTIRRAHSTPGLGNAEDLDEEEGEVQTDTEFEGDELVINETGDNEEDDQVEHEINELSSYDMDEPAMEPQYDNHNTRPG